MKANLEFFVFLAFMLLFLDLILILSIIVRRVENYQEYKEFIKAKNRLLDAVRGKPKHKKVKSWLTAYYSLKQSFQLGRETEEKIRSSSIFARAEKRYIAQLNSFSRLKRKEAASVLGVLATERARSALEERMSKEKSPSVKLYLANALSDIGNKDSLPVLVNSLLNANRWYRQRVNMLIAGYGKDFHDYMPYLVESERLEIKELLVDFASLYPSPRTKEYLVQLISSKKEAIAKLDQDLAKKTCQSCLHMVSGINLSFGTCRYKGVVTAGDGCSRHKILPALMNYRDSYERLVLRAAEVLAELFPEVLKDKAYLQSEDVRIKEVAVRALSRLPLDENLQLALGFLRDDEVYRSAIFAVSGLVEKNPRYLDWIVKAFRSEKDFKMRSRMAEILALRMEYFITRLVTAKKDIAFQVIKEVLLLGKTSELIDFIHKNKNLELENELVEIIKEVSAESEVLKNELAQYLPERVAKKCGLTVGLAEERQKEVQRGRDVVIGVYSLLVLGFLLVPMIYVLRHYDLLFNTALRKQLELFVLEFNYYLAYYCLAISSIYLFLLLVSFFHVKEQERLWQAKSETFLFKKNMLPSVSIIAPAYNEEKTIIESVNSLLNLKYPDYELIIVNDGSKDRTLQVLIDHFALSRVDYLIEPRLKTQRIKGIYMNRSLPGLIVVDKENGGKADSLNAGINVSCKEYFCGIDADSLLESDALLKLASMVLDEDVEVSALGGNVLPINGCRVERGKVVEVGVPQNPLARFQTMEYLRAFMAGRLGWSKLGSLLIISGAFGLFRKERVIDIGGYLTRSERYAKDTVGEDMELVVRINRLMREKGLGYRIFYSFNANCWTEVPEDMKSLKRQRYRWHRGLIEILSFHKNILFNWRYGRIGLAAMPYFLIFEAFGPLIEVQGYIMVLVAYLLGLLNVHVAVLLFIANVLLGILISLSSLFIAERNLKALRAGDIGTLVLYAFLENFGPRQLISFWRFGGTIDMLRKPRGWGKPERKGFSSDYDQELFRGRVLA